jgi:hypothetical protein
MALSEYMFKYGDRYVQLFSNPKGTKPHDISRFAHYAYTRCTSHYGKSLSYLQHLPIIQCCPGVELVAFRTFGTW